MALAERLVERIERTALGRQLDRLGAFSPLTTLRTFSPGARAMLASTERSAELGIHLARGFILCVGSLAALLFLDVGAVVPPILLVPSLVAAAAGWLAIWRVLRRPRPPWWLRYVLIVGDAGFAVNDVFVIRSPLYHQLGLDRLYTQADLATISSALLVAVSLSGGFRLIPQAAAFSMAVSLTAYAYVAAALEIPRNQAVVVALIIWLAGVLGAQAARLFRQMALKAREQAVLERYVPEALTRELARSGDPTGTGRETDVTVLIVDIRGYTRRAERLTPRETVAFLNDYFSIVVGPLAEHGAIVDKYIGDGVHSFFEGPDHQRRAMAAAREIARAVDLYNASRPDAEPVSIGIALHSGRALVGTIGAEHKREYTAIADTVNLAARLEELNKSFGSRIVASEAVIAAAAPNDTHGFVGPELMPIRGHDAPLAVRYLPT